MSQLFASCGQSIGASVSVSVLPMNIQDWLPLGLTGLISLQSKGVSRVFPNTTVQKHQFFSTQLSLWLSLFLIFFLFFLFLNFFFFFSLIFKLSFSSHNHLRLYWCSTKAAMDDTQKQLVMFQYNLIYKNSWWAGLPPLFRTCLFRCACSRSEWRPSGRRGLSVGERSRCIREFRSGQSAI